MLDAALAHARKGQQVLPLWWTDAAGTCQCPKGKTCPSPGKHPRTEGGLHDATLGETVIRQWWKRWPKANLGARTDVVHRFDVDSTQVAEALQSEASLFAMTEAVRTPRPGLHIAFLPPAPMRTKTLYLADGTRLGELRGLNAYVVVPPSRIADRAYAPLSPCDVVPVRLPDPFAWLDVLLKEHGYELGQAPPAREYNRLAGIIFEGEGRHNALVSAAGRFHIEGLGVDALAGALDAVNQFQCRPPLLYDDVLAIAQHRVNNHRPGKGETSFLSAAYRDSVPAERNERLVFRTAAELEASTPAEVPWVAKPWIARGGTTELDGKVKASGKTTFLTWMVRSILDGLLFLGEATAKTAVVYLTEQADASFREALRRAGILGREDLHILSWKDAAGVPWEEVVEAAVQECLRVGAGVLVIDTLPQFAGIEGDGENSSGAALEAMRPLQLAAGRHNLAVIFSRHERKSGGEVGDSGRGSSAFAGGADIVMALRRADNDPESSLRAIYALSRFDETPASLLVELTDHGYEARGSVKGLAVHHAREALEDFLPDEEGRAATMEELLAATGAGRSSLQEALDAMRKEGVAGRTGDGKRGRPYRYWRP